MNWLKLTFLLVSYSTWSQEVGFALEQIHAKALIEKGFNGKGVKVGIIDGGFLNADNSRTLTHLFENGQIKGYKDYLNPKAKPFSGSKALDDGHGTEVLSLVSGYDREKKIQFGLATDANFYLARTDHGAYEDRKEEIYAIKAMEWMAKQGVKIINISLGYTNGYDDKRDNYSQSQMDGKSTLITKKVDELSKKYGVLFIVAAGNDGDRPWEIIGAPGDARSALTVGATKFKIWDEMAYSSKGPEWLPYIKPEVVCYSSVGTSFSAPIITGLAACILEKNPELNGEELKDKIISLCNLSYAPNNLLGYGVPDCRKLFSNEKTPQTIKAKNTYKLELIRKQLYIPVYHKKDGMVIQKEILRPKGKRIKIKKEKGSTSTTLLIENKGMEIEWIN